MIIKYFRSRPKEGKKKESDWIFKVRIEVITISLAQFSFEFHKIPSHKYVKVQNQKFSLVKCQSITNYDRPSHNAQLSLKPNIAFQQLVKNVLKKCCEISKKKKNVPASLAIEQRKDSGTRFLLACKYSFTDPLSMYSMIM